MKILTMAQHSDEWFRERLGRVTASELEALISPTWKAKESAGVETYLYKKLAEKSLGFSMAMGGAGFAAEQGTILESEAVPFYEMKYDIDVQRVGMVLADDERVSCSPDGLVGKDGGLEIKCGLPETHLRYLIEGVLPKEYAAQVHGSLWVTGRQWWDFLSYSRQFPPFIIRVNRDEKIQQAIAAAINPFLERFEQGMSVIKKLKANYNAARQAEYDSKPKDKSK